MTSRCILLASLLCCTFHFSAGVRSATFTAALSSNTYDEFRLVHRAGTVDSVSYLERHALFKASAVEVAAHNSQRKSWTKKLNRFADYTSDELRSSLGYKRAGGRWSQSSAVSSFLATHTDEGQIIDVSSLAKHVDWRSKMNVSNFVHNQGGCGSCWAHAAVGAMEAHAEISTGIGTKLSTQSIIDCTANPRHCGGTGGCQGATAELAFEHAKHFGIPPMASTTAVEAADSDGCSQAKPDAMKLHSFVRLPENKGSYLLHALATTGPVAVSLDASELHSYDTGVFSGCGKDSIINHAVLAVGYGLDAKSGKLYWTIRNSWGQHWGEDGHFRIERHESDEAYCGTDVKPQDGVACEDHPDTVPVCGMCGITADSSYPIMSSGAALAQVKASTRKLKLSRTQGSA